MSYLLIVLFQACTPQQNQDTLKENPPNILFIVADDIGYEKLGSYNGLHTNTPNIDALAKKGVQFMRAYTSPVCTPSRMTIYTGRYPTNHQYTNVLPVHLGTKEFVDFKAIPTYAQLLRDNGYLTSVTGKWQLAALEYHPEHCKLGGFDSWCVWQIWKDNKKTTRYWQATLNEDGKIRNDIDSLFGPDVLTNYVIEQMQEAKAAGKPFAIQHNMMLPHWPIIQTPDDKKLEREASLDNMIAYMDKQVGILLEAVEKLGVSDNTIIIFAGDNGTETKEIRLTKQGKVQGGKHTMTDAGAHVPLIFYQPKKMEGGRKVNQLIDFADLFPTFCQLAGIELEEEMAIDGVSFHKLLNGEKQTTRAWVTAGYRGKYMIFDGKWRWHHNDQKLIDCRNLPTENEADMNSLEAQNAKEKLNEIMQQLLKENQEI